MIINIRGTSGSGKSTLVRRVMDLYPTREPQMVEGRRQPLSYLLTRGALPGLVVPGHYETECGGCDTIKTLDQAIAIAMTATHTGCDVLMEGLLASENVGKFVALRDALQREVEPWGDGAGRATPRDPPLVVIALTTSTEECLAAVADRRRRRGDERPLDPRNTINRVRTIERACARLRAAGVQVEELRRGAAFRRVCALLRLDPGATSGA
jgi:hypothetical protein